MLKCGIVSLSFAQVCLKYVFPLFLCNELERHKTKVSSECLKGMYSVLFIEASSVQLKYQIHMWQNLILLQKSKKMKCILHQI